MDGRTARSHALNAAALLHADEFARDRGDPRTEDVLRTANRLTEWLLGAAHIRFLLGPVIEQGIASPPAHHHRHTTEGAVMAALTDTQKFAVTVQASDSKGFPVADSFTFTEDSNGAVITVTAGEDGKSAIVSAVAPGSAVLTATDADGITGTLAVDVTTGGVASIVMTATDPTEQ